MQLNLFNNQENIVTQVKNGKYLIIPNFYNHSESRKFMEAIARKTKWKQEKMNMYGKEVLFPRQTAWYGDQDKDYSFSGLKLRPEKWTSELLEIKDDIEKLGYGKFNSVLLNHYRDGSDSISWHSDSEKELGKNPIIASLSFGATRKFQLRHKLTKEKITLELQHGTLLIMMSEMQHYWQHQIPKTKSDIGQRINLTFRYIYDLG